MRSTWSPTGRTSPTGSITGPRAPLTCSSSKRSSPATTCRTSCRSWASWIPSPDPGISNGRAARVPRPGALAFPDLLRGDTILEPEPGGDPHACRAEGGRVHTAQARAEPGWPKGLAPAGGGYGQAVYQGEPIAERVGPLGLPRGAHRHVPPGATHLAGGAVRARGSRRGPELLAPGRSPRRGPADLLRGAADLELARGRDTRREFVARRRGERAGRRVLELVLLAAVPDANRVLRRGNRGGEADSVRPAGGGERDRRWVHGRVLGDDLGHDPSLRVRLDGPDVGGQRYAVFRGLAAAARVSRPRDLQLDLARSQDGAPHVYLPVDTLDLAAPAHGPADGLRLEGSGPAYHFLAVRYRRRGAGVPVDFRIEEGS